MSSLRKLNTSTTRQNAAFNSLHSFLELSISRQSLPLTRQTHTQILTSGHHQNPFLATKLITSYANCGIPHDSRLVFDSLSYKNVFLYNTLITGYVKNRCFIDALVMFSTMCYDGVLFDEYTLAGVCKACGEIGELAVGKVVHGVSVKVGVVGETVVGNSVMSMYSKCGEFEECMRLFEETPVRRSSSWNIVISGFAGLGGGSGEEVWRVFREMQSEGVEPSAYTVSSLLPLCGDGGDGGLNYGRELHCYILKNGLDSVAVADVHLGCCLVDMYSRNGGVLRGRMVFERMRSRNVFAWTAMINGYVQAGDLDEALMLFRDMQITDGIEPNRVSLVSVLPACSSLAELLLGKQVHGFAIRKELDHDVSLCNALVDMYSKCGSLYSARRVFDSDIFSKDAISWSSMICGYGLHGKGGEAVMLYNEMLQLGIKPDMISMVGVLSACGRSGLVNEGLNIYTSAINDYGIEPTQEICSCVVDMLGRSGQLDRALEFIKTMPMEPGPSVWGSLVRVSEIQGNSEMRDLAYSFLIQVEPGNPSNYIWLSNLYASSEKWDVVAEVRSLMKDRGLRKAPGCSWITINNETHCFVVADKVHPHSNLIYKMLDKLILMMKGVAETSDFGCIA